MEQPIANIQVTMSIPPQKYVAASMEIMSQYGNVVQEALQDIKKDLMFNEEFQNEVKNTIRQQIQESVENAVKSAARQVVWDLFRDKDSDIEQMVEKALLETMHERKKWCIIRRVRAEWELSRYTNWTQMGDHETYASFLIDWDMTKYYKVTIDDEVFDEGLTYREACELAEELDNSREYYWKTVDVVPMEG